MSIRLMSAALLLLVHAGPATAESIEKGLDLSVFESFERKEQERQREGVVLEKARDRRGKGTTLSFGGSGREEDPFYDFGATQNIRAARESEVGQGLLNLRISF